MKLYANMVRIGVLEPKYQLHLSFDEEDILNDDKYTVGDFLKDFFWFGKIVRSEIEGGCIDYVDVWYKKSDKKYMGHREYIGDFDCMYDAIQALKNYISKRK